jgi:hypothetical protein
MIVVAQLSAWLGAILLVLGAVAIGVIASRLGPRLLAVAAALPVGVGLLLLAFQLEVPAPHPAFRAALAIALVALGVIAGGPLAAFVLEIASHDRIPLGDNGGILVEKDDAPRDGTREVLRGGATIGYLERAAIIAGIVLGRWEVVAVIVAIKGVGRYSELDSAQARERFIIGTLVSFLWAGACAALIVL